MHLKNINHLLHQDFISIFEGYDLINYINLTEIELLQILRYRNSLSVRAKMVDNQVISKINHLNFVKSLPQKMIGYWALKNEKNIIGSISMVDYNKEKQSFVAGNFLSPDLINSGKGFLINYLTRILAFEKIKCQQILAHVKKDNLSALRANQLFDNNTAKDINNIDYVSFKFLLNDWVLIKSKVEKYLKYVI